MKLSRKAKLVFAGILLFYLTCYLLLNYTLGAYNGGKPVIYSDGKGHYDYLPKLFLEGDIQYDRTDHLFTSNDGKGHYINRFYCGTALLETPFFLGGMLYAWLAGYEIDGYSPPFHYAVGLAAIFYSLWGLIILFKLLLRFFNINETNALWTIVFTAAGTNLLFYTTWFGTFSHSFSFFAVTAFFYRLSITIQDINKKNVFLLGLLFALIAVIRPVNILIILLVPAFFNDWKLMFSFIKKLLTPWLLGLMAFGLFIPLFIQCWIWYMQADEWVVWSYRQEGFNFSNPKISQVLFGFRRGLFIYCPLLFICLFGFILSFRQNKWRSAWMFIFLFAFTYVTASWWHWTYGDTFGIRPFNDILIVFMLLFAFLLTHAGNMKKYLIGLCFIFTFFNLVFTYQFASGITNISTMDSDKFFRLFLKTGKEYRYLYGGCKDPEPFAPNGFKTLWRKKSDFNDLPGGVWHVKGDEFIPGIDTIYPASEAFTRHIWIQVRFKRKLLKPDGMKGALFIFHTLDFHKDSTRTYHASRMKEYPLESTGKWKTVQHDLWLPDVAEANNRIKAYIWNKEKEEFFIDDYDIHIQVPRW